MKPSPKYDTSGLIEAQYEPGSRGRVLRNRLGIKTKREMDRAEHAELLRANAKTPAMFDKKHRFTAKDICNIHKVWLGEIYEWAGEYRQVDVSKGDFWFSSAMHIHKLMGDLEKGQLAKYTPCLFGSIEEIARAIATVHVELVLVHPFREGNGRLARMVANLMAMQADLPPLDYAQLDKKKWDDYIRAIHAGMENDYGPMTDIFTGVIEQTLKKPR